MEIVGAAYPGKYLFVKKFPHECAAAQFLDAT